MKKIFVLCVSFLMLFCIACNKTPDRLADGSVKFTAENYYAREICHEVDHLDGILIVDREECE